MYYLNQRKERDALMDQKWAVSDQTSVMSLTEAGAVLSKQLFSECISIISIAWFAISNQLPSNNSCSILSTPPLVNKWMKDELNSQGAFLPLPLSLSFFLSCLLQSLFLGIFVFAIYVWVYLWSPTHCWPDPSSTSSPLFSSSSPFLPPPSPPPPPICHIW